MKHWGKAAICWIGIVVGLSAATAAASSGKRTISSRQVASVDSVQHARHHTTQHSRARHAKSQRLAQKINGSHRKAKERTSRLRVFSAGRPVQRTSAIYRLGKPYMIGGRTYTPRVYSVYRAEGKASWYGSGFQGRLTANGEKFDMRALSAAHPTLPLPSYVRVTNLENRRSLVVRVNDRGPFHGNRLIDVSVRAAELLGFHDQGVAQVRVEFIGLAARASSRKTKLASTTRR